MRKIGFVLRCLDLKKVEFDLRNKMFCFIAVLTNSYEEKKTFVPCCWKHSEISVDFGGAARKGGK
jgi:hypothetical protein